jgi:FKBP-type peptidyl-prolyl cis-trans isomerase SlpA
MSITINPQSRVTLHFALQVKPAESQESIVIDSTFDKSPATFLMGDGSLLPGFEQKLLGLAAGDEKTFVLPAREAFGEIHPDSIHVLDVKQFNHMELSEGLVVSFEGAGKRPMPGVVKKIAGNAVTVDFNHPLAGQTVHFVVKILNVENATIAKG